MKRRFHIILSLLIVCNFYNCTKKEISSIETIEQGKLLEVGTLKYGDKEYFEDCFLVPLETTESSLIASISQIELSENTIYTFDRNLSKILMFDLAGKYIGNVGNQGQGPEEYISISGFYIDSQNKTINLFDPIGMCVIQYNLSGGFIKKTSHDNKNLSFVRKAIPIGKDELFCYYGSNWEDNSLYSIVSTSDFYTIRNVRSYPGTSTKNMSYVYSNQPFTLYDDNIVYGTLFSDTISIYKDNKIEPYLIISDETENIPLNSLNKKLKDVDNNYTLVMTELINENKYTPGVINIFENNRYIFYDFKVKLYSFNAILWDKKKQKGLYLKEYLHNNIDFSLIKYYNDNIAIREWNNMTIHSFKEQILNDPSLRTQYPEPVMNVIDAYNEEDNPILIFYKFRE